MIVMVDECLPAVSAGAEQSSTAKAIDVFADHAAVVEHHAVIGDEGRYLAERIGCDMSPGGGGGKNEHQPHAPQQDIRTIKSSRPMNRDPSRIRLAKRCQVTTRKGKSCLSQAGGRELSGRRGSYVVPALERHCKALRSGSVSI